MTTVITGHRGWIGSKLYAEIGGFGIDVREGHNLLSCDLPDADIVYHLAAQSSVEASWHDPMHDSDNIKMMVRLVQRYPDAKIIYTNSAASLDTSSPYGFSKWACGEYLKRFHSNYVSCVLPNIYGPGSRSVVDIFKGKEIVNVYGDGTSLRDYVHVDDIVQGLVMAQNWPVGEYQLGSGISTSVLELAAGKTIMHLPARKESPESLLKNTTPDWRPKIQLAHYL